MVPKPSNISDLGVSGKTFASSATLKRSVRPEGDIAGKTRANGICRIETEAAYIDD